MRIVLIIVAAIAASIVSVDAQLSKKALTFENEQIIQYSDSVYFQLDSTYTYTTNGSSWLIDSKSSYKYDSNRTIIHSLTQSNNNGIWINKTRVNYNYSTNNTGWTKEHFDWNNDQQTWQNVWKKSYSQKDANNQLNIIYSEWNANNSWNNIWQQDQYYNNSGQLLSYQTIKWNNERNKWESYWDYNCYYDSNGNLLQTTHKAFNTDNQVWNDNMECINEYEAGLLKSEQIIDWDENSQNWKNLARINVSTTTSEEQRIKEYWDKNNNNWKKGVKILVTKNSNDQIIKKQVDLFNEQTQQWHANRLEMYTYDDYGINTEKSTLYWNQASNSWDNYSKIVYHYTKSTISEDEDTMPPSQEIVIYPNPAESEVYLKFNEVARDLKIYTIQGKLVMQIYNPVMGQAINIDKLKNGAYLVIVNFESGQAQAKLIKK